MSNGINLGSILSTAVGFLVGGPAGALVANFAKQAMMSVVDNVIEDLPISDTLKEALQTGFHAGMGDVPGAIKNAHEFIDELGAELGLDAADVGDMQRSVDEFEDSVENWLDEAIKNIIDSADDSESDAASETGKGKGAGAGGAEGAGWLYALAKALGEKLDSLSDEMQTAAENIDEEDPSTVVDFQMASQRFTIVMNAASTALKSVGEGMTQAARKQ